jgi:hypothetical protein
MEAAKLEIAAVRTRMQTNFNNARACCYYWNHSPSYVDGPD